MKIGEARRAAVDWVIRHARSAEGYMGAYYSGSTVGLSDELELPAFSDIDIVVVTALTEPPLKPGKLVHCGVLLEVTYLSMHQIAVVEEVLSSYHLAGSFRLDTIIDDPSGRLRTLQSQVALEFNEMYWVRKRCENVMKKIEGGLGAIDTNAPLHDLATSWLFPTGVTTHVILVAALCNPTVRLRYSAARNVLVRYGLEQHYPCFLDQLGCTGMSPQQVEAHLIELEKTFDAAAGVAKTPFFFSSDITAYARPVVIDGSRELIRTGYHREAVFWMAATFARCHKIMAADAPPGLQQTFALTFEAMLSDLGMTSRDDFNRRGEETIRFLPSLWEVAKTIMAANPDIKK
ncbi:hypothetical protein [Paenibacillus jiagnxiensis]|uniref:hypothetical protein n=1 Tax=Paenibacillus jiagnxiensis TaxID=3228926 RepID=UPI0033BF6C6D